MLLPQLAVFVLTARDMPELQVLIAGMRVSCCTTGGKGGPSIFLHYRFGVRVKTSDLQQNQISWVEKDLSDEKCVTAAVTP